VSNCHRFRVRKIGAISSRRSSEALRGLRRCLQPKVSKEGRRQLRSALTIHLVAWLAVSAVIVHATATVLLHWLVPSVNALSEMVSAYLSTEYQWLSRVAFAALALALGFIGLGLVLHQIQGAILTVALVLVAIAVVGSLGVAAVPSAARVFAVPTQPAAVCAILLFSLVLRQEPVWQGVGPYLLGVGFGLVALLFATIVLGVLVSAGAGGLANRLVLILIYSWVLLVARGLLMTSVAGTA
jgi:hypothetical protein